MNWGEEIVTSLIWLAKAFVISGLGFSVVFGAILYRTKIGRDFLRLSGEYFSFKRAAKPLLLLAAVIVFALISVRLSVLIGYAQNGFYTAMQELDSGAFWFNIIIWCIIAALSVTRALFNYYVRNTLEINWRVWLTERLVDKWLNHQNYFRSHYAKLHVDNPDQRIQQDVDSFITLSLTLSVGLLGACVSLFEFSILLWMLSGTLMLFGIAIPKAMIILVVVYVFLTTIVAFWLGRPLIQLNFSSEKFNANFRYALIRLREYGESIAFFRGEAVEKNQLLQRFKLIISNSWAIVFRTLKFNGFNLTVNQVAVIFPLIIQAPRLFAKEIKLGDIAQSSQAFGEVQESLSFFRTSYDSYASYRAVMIRLIGYLDMVDETETLGRVHPRPKGDAFHVSHLQLQHPRGHALINDLNLHLTAGQSLIIQGPSGAGKTSLLRALAGLWPYAKGEVDVPPQATSLFLPQKPYLPLGSLAAALAYPRTDWKENDLQTILGKVQLAHVAPHLADEQDWTQSLSLGEQQRLAIGRILVMQPDIVFLDEATSAMDEGMELALYTLIRETFPQCIIISVGHRSSLLGFHQQELRLDGEGGWTLNQL